MTKSQPSRLGSGMVIVKKGEASPVLPKPEGAPVAAQVPDNLAPVVPPMNPVAPANEAVSTDRAIPSPEPIMPKPAVLLATKSMTVKIDVDTYRKLKAHGVAIDRTSQDIFIEALALYFKAKKL